MAEGITQNLSMKDTTGIKETVGRFNMYLEVGLECRRDLSMEMMKLEEQLLNNMCHRKR